MLERPADSAGSGRPCRGRDADSSWRRVAAKPRPRRGMSAETTAPKRPLRNAAAKRRCLSATTLAKRAEVLLDLERPVAAIADCDAALGLNPDSCRALKVRGKVKAALGDFEAANLDLSKAQSIDFDPELKATRRAGATVPWRCAVVAGRDRGAAAGARRGHSEGTTELTKIDGL